MKESKLLQTPLYRCHLQLGARMVPFAGYDMPVQYTSLLDEATSVRKQAGLFDVSHMGQFWLRGKNSLGELQKLVTNDLSKLSVGQAQYNMLCNESGGVIDDLVIYRRTDTDAFICVNASNRKADFDWMKSHLNGSVVLEDQSDATALIALQGPEAESILATSTKTDLKSVKYYWAAEGKVFDVPAYISRTGYTGEDGFELYVPSQNAADIWEKLLENGRKKGLVACGLGARDTLRLEMGYPLHGHELSPTISPLAAGLGWVVKLDLATPFIGQAALKKEKAEGSPRVLKAFRLRDRRSARQGYRVTLPNGTPVGEITSGTFSPTLTCPIAMGLVEGKAATAPALCVEIRTEVTPVDVVSLPFVARRTKK